MNEETIPPPLPDPSADVPEDEKIPHTWIAGADEFQKTVGRFQESVESFKTWVRWGAVALGLAFVTIGLVAIVSLHHSDQNTKQLKERSAARDKLQAQTDARLNQQAAAIAAIQNRSQRAVCALVVGSVQQDKDNGNPPSPLTLQFAQDYGCIVPQALGGTSPPKP